MSSETWKPVPIEGLEVYEISNLGQCRNTRTGRILQPDTLRNGYLRYAMSVNGIVKRVSAHRLVAEAFVPNDGQKEYVNHLDGDKSNNKASNLEWATQSENQYHAVEIGLQPVGSDTNYAKLIESDIRIIRYLLFKGKSNVEISGRFGVTASLIGQIKRRKWWKHVDDSIVDFYCEILEEMIDIVQNNDMKGTQNE